MTLGFAIKRRFQGYDVEMLVGRRRILQAGAVIEAHRRRSRQDGQAVTSLEWFLSKRAIWGELPVVALIRRDGVLLGVVLLYYSTAFGLPYGLVRGGRRGDVSVIAPVADQRRILETAGQFLVQHALAHTVILTLRLQETVDASPGASPDAIPDGGSPGWTGYGTAARWVPRQSPQRLSLAGGFDATLQRLSYKLRRNLRYYRRRASDEQIRFEPELSLAQRRDAVTALSDKGRFPTTLSQARIWDRALQAVPSSFAMGLQNPQGTWLSYVVGWREASATYIDWQLNDEQEATSTVMRSYLLEHETARRSPALVFVGGTSAIWRRACEPAMESDLVVTGLRPVTRFLSNAYQRLRPDTDAALLCKGTAPA